MSAAWHKLPFEVLTNIFAHSVNDRYIPSRRALYNYQLVCKGWSKAAQSLLYKRISCQDRDTERELQRFVHFIYTLKVLAPQVGTFVKTIVVCSHLDRLEEPLTALDAIFSSCPNLEEFYCNGSSKEIAWPYLLTLPDTKVGGIRSILEGKDTCDYTPLYPFVAIKLKRSLSKLHHVGIQRISSWGSTYLLNNLSQFVSLQELSLHSCEFSSYDQICQVIDKCSSTVSKLSICKYLAVDLGEAPISKVDNPNYSIKEVEISNSVVNTVSYFAAKFKNLQKLTMEQVVSSQMSKPDWIHGLVDLCVSLREYKLRFNLGLEPLIHDHCIHLTKRSSPKDTFLVIDYNVVSYGIERETSNPTWGITLKKDGTRSGIEVSFPWTDRDEGDITPYCDYHLDWFDDYSPNQITIDNVEADDFMNSEQKYRDLATATTFTEFALGFRDVDRHESIEARNWAILAKSLFSTVDTMDADVSFSDMVIPNLKGRTTHLEKSSSPNVKDLTFTNAILYHQVLAIISSWLPKLDTLTIDACYILMEDSYTLRINMQETKLRRLVLIAGPVSFANGIFEEETVAGNQLENIDFADALLPENQYTVRIEANEKTYLFNVKDDTRSPINIQDQEADCYGTSDNFLIWIQFKELEEVSIVDGLYPKQLERQFIPLD